MCRRWLVMMMVTVMLMAGVIADWNCVCEPNDCEALEPSGCPGKGVVVWDACGCCEVCARTASEDCGGFKGTCEPGLTCHNGLCTPVK